MEHQELQSDGICSRRTHRGLPSALLVVVRQVDNAANISLLEGSIALLDLLRLVRVAGLADGDQAAGTQPVRTFLALGFGNPVAVAVLDCFGLAP